MLPNWLFIPLKWLVSVAPKLVGLASKVWSGRPTFKTPPASLLASSKSPLPRGDARAILREAVGKDGHYVLWQHAIDLLLADLGKGDLDQDQLTRLRHACDVLYDESITTSWQYASTGRLIGIEKKLWLSVAASANAISGCQVGPALSVALINDLASSQALRVPSGATDCRIAWLRSLTGRRSPLLIEQAGAGKDSEFCLSVKEHRVALQQIANEAQEKHSTSSYLAPAALATSLVAVAIVVGGVIGFRQGEDKARSQVMVEGVPWASRFLSDPRSAEGMLSALLSPSVEDPSNMIYSPADVLALLLASSGELSTASELATGVRKRLGERRCDYDERCTELITAFKPPKSFEDRIASSDVGKDEVFIDSSSPIHQLACLEHRNSMWALSDCKVEDDAAYDSFEGCRVPGAFLDSMERRDWDENANRVRSGILFGRLKLAIRRLQCSGRTTLPTILEQGSVEELILDEDECSGERGGLETLSWAGEVAGLVVNDLATIQTDPNRKTSILKWRGWVEDAFFSVAGQPSITPDCLAQLVEGQTGERVAFVLRWLQVQPPTDRRSRETLGVVARRILESPVGWREDWWKEAADSPEVFLEAARTLLGQLPDSKEDLLKSGKCGFHCLAAISTVICQSERLKKGILRNDGLSLAPLADPSCASAWRQITAKRTQKPAANDSSKET